jgi:hypothetical protein
LHADTCVQCGLHFKNVVKFVHAVRDIREHGSLCNLIVGLCCAALFCCGRRGGA